MPRSWEALRTTKDTIPASTALTPTVTTVGTYFSISVADASVQAGAVFYIPAQSATRKIKSILFGYFAKSYGAMENPRVYGYLIAIFVIFG